MPAVTEQLEKVNKSAVTKNFVDLLEKICKETGKSKEEIWELVEKKREELDYLISEEGALHIIASELGVSLKERKKISDLKEEGGINLVLKVLKVFEKREFERNGKKGKVKNLLAGDETGNAIVSLWDDKAEIEVKEGDIIKISGAYAKKSEKGIEIRVGRRASVEINPESFPEELKRVNSYEEKKLRDVKENDFVKVRAALTRVFPRDLFFESPEGKQLVVSGIIDDGTAALRAVFFRKAAEKLIGVSRESAIEVAKIAGQETLLNKIPLGKEFWIGGKVKLNEVSGNLELIVNWIREVDPGEEVEKKLERFMGIE